ncbi:MAG: 50S ribosomal protein L13 [Magnetococcales bacterium]|nr:50S ribosomal protein L13 [Magnetococcales bacterium]
MKTYMAKPADIDRKWYVVDAEQKVLGRLATQVAMRLRGKHKPQYTPHMDTGDFIVIINAEKIKLTGNKLDDKMYYHHSGYIGGIKSKSAKEALTGQFPERVIESAVRGMLPKTPLGREMFRKLRVYSGSEHPHEAQKPETLDI